MKKIILLTAMLTTAKGMAAQFDDVVIKPEQVKKQVYVLYGAGGNIGYFAGNQGGLMIDDQFAPLAERIDTAMAKLNKQPLKYIVNTHLHGDHTGGNNFFATKAPIIAQQNVRARLAQKPKEQAVALPVVTYQNQMTIHLDDETIKLIHLPAGHTDGDTAVYFEQANVLHTGDLFFELGFPYIDLANGGSVKGYLANIKQLLATMPDDVTIIPGHGKVTDKKRYQEFANMIEHSINFVEQALIEGKTEQQIIEQGLGEEYKVWSWSFINEQKWLKTLITDLSANKSQ